MLMLPHMKTKQITIALGDDAPHLRVGAKVDGGYVTDAVGQQQGFFLGHKVPVGEKRVGANVVREHLRKTAATKTKPGYTGGEERPSFASTN